ncbi:MAG: ATP-binding protein [Ginsengibacter sp.]
MLRRDLLEILQNDLKKIPAVVLFGPRQVGKTTIAKELAAINAEACVYLDMELPSDRVKLSDMELFLSPLVNKTVIIDEVQLIPELFPVLRSLIDKERRPGRFLLLGSASPDLLQKSAESLAGRVRYREAFPLTLDEAGGAKEQNELWFRGGFPDAFIAKSQQEAMDWQADFVRTYATRDMAMLGLPMPAIQIERLLQMLAHMHGQLVNYSQLGRSLGVSQPTITNAMHYLEQAMLIRTLKPWHHNMGKRLVKTPKVYIRDTGMLHYLLGLSSYQQLLGHPQAGNSWEGFVIQQILAVLPRRFQFFFYRTSGGSELDLLLMKGNAVDYALEIKLSTAPQLTRGNSEAALDLQPLKRVVIAPVSGIFSIKDKWVVYGVDEFLKEMKVNF